VRLHRRMPLSSHPAPSSHEVLMTWRMRIRLGTVAVYLRTSALQQPFVPLKRGMFWAAVPMAPTLAEAGIRTMHLSWRRWRRGAAGAAGTRMPEAGWTPSGAESGNASALQRLSRLRPRRRMGRAPPRAVLPSLSPFLATCGWISVSPLPPPANPRWEAAPASGGPARGRAVLSNIANHIIMIHIP
jgi:hypothetical protein